MAEPKTRLNDFPVADFIAALPDERVRQDCWTIIDIMQAAARSNPRMWGSAIIGFGSAPVTYADGKVRDWPLIAFSPRKQALTFYLNLGGIERASDLLSRLGKHSLGKGCLYIKRLSDVDLAVLKELVQESVTNGLENHPQDAS